MDHCVVPLQKINTMEKIFFGNTALILTKEHPMNKPAGVNFGALEKSGLNLFLNSIDFAGEEQILHVWGQDPEEMLNYFVSNLKYIPAAGGLVQNPSGEILFIFRHSKWDLPKGKPEEEESTEETALREVEEECGISGLKILNPLPSTWHIYPLEPGLYAIKQSFWFHMTASIWEELVVQTEEDITKAQWIAMPVPDYILRNAFLSVRELVVYFQTRLLS